MTSLNCLQTTLQAISWSTILLGIGFFIYSKMEFVAIENIMTKKPVNPKIAERPYFAILQSANFLSQIVPSDRRILANSC